jgi:hypothetical protein
MRPGSGLHEYASRAARMHLPNIRLDDPLSTTASPRSHHHLDHPGMPGYRGLRLDGTGGILLGVLLWLPKIGTHMRVQILEGF